MVIGVIRSTIDDGKAQVRSTQRARIGSSIAFKSTPRVRDPLFERLSQERMVNGASAARRSSSAAARSGQAGSRGA